MKVRKMSIALTVSLLCCILPISCSGVKIKFEEIKEKFSIYEADVNVGVLLDDESLYFYDKTLKFREIIPKDTQSISKIALQFIGTDVYIAACEEYDWWGFNFGFLVYKYDLIEDKITSVLTKENVKNLKYLFNEETIYFEYTTGAAEKTLDSYNVITGEYKNISSDKSCSIEQYQPGTEKQRYTYTISNKKKNEFSITDTDTSRTFCCDASYFKQTQYYNLLEQYPFELNTISEYKGISYVTYLAQIGSGFGEQDYVCVVFEADLTNNTLIYKSIVGMYDLEWYSVVNIVG